MKYKALKTITPSAIYDAIPNKSCSSYAEHFKSLVLRFPAGLNVGLSLDDLMKWAERDPKRVKFLVDKGFVEKVEKVEEKTYSTGQWFRFGSDERYHLCYIGHGKVALLHESGGRWDEPKRVGDADNITEGDLVNIMESYRKDFTPITVEIKEVPF